VKPAPFAYAKPATVAEAVALLGEHGADARVLAGGQSLVPMLGMRLMRPAALVDINGLGAELGTLEVRGRALVVGALVRYSELERSPLVAEHLPLLQQVVRHIGDRQVRNRGTLGGAVAQADPTGEMPLVCLTLGARVLARSPRGERTIPIEDFFLGSYFTALEPDELLTAVVFALAPAHCRFFERGRKHNDFALLSVAAVGSTEADGTWRDVRVGLGGVNDTPVLAGDTARLLEGRRWDAELIARAAELALEAVDPPDDVRATAEYRRHLVPVHVRRTLTDLAGATTHG
jgi:carbon-monoxide dehydrogenase medium subunit